jgi:DNA-binding response OmpR family regulator/HPt (histidine-containing phosphotransfer) domain-containing protein
MKILFIEDDQHTCEVISAILTTHRYAVDVVTDGEAGLEMATQWDYDLILLDVMLPKLNGFELCRSLRDRACQTPILILTSKGANEDIVAGLDAGADDYVVKSCDPTQLLARVRALLRRVGEVAPAPRLTWGHLCLDPAAAQVTYGQTPVPCRPKEYTLLELFLRYPQRLLSRTNIIDHLWSFDDAPVEGSVTTLIKDLRRRLKAAGMPQDPIETVYGLGYRLKPAPQVVPPAQAMVADRPRQVPEPAPADISAEHRLQAVIQQADANFKASWSQRLAGLAGAAQAFKTGDFTLEQQKNALAQVHKLVGGLGTFGYDNASAVAEALELFLAEHISQEQQWADEFSQLLGDLQQALEAYAAPDQGPLTTVKSAQHRG